MPSTTSYRSHIAVATFVSAAGLAAPAAAAPSARGSEVAVALDWNGAPGCATLAEERVALVALTGRFVEADAARASFTIHVDFDRGKDEWIARVRLTRADQTPLGERELRSSGASCRALDRSVTLTVGLLIDLEVERQEAARKEAEAEAEAPSRTPLTPPPPPAPPPPHQFRVTAEPATAPRDGWAVSAGALATATIGLLPTLAEGAGLGARIAPPHGLPPINVSAIYMPPHDAHVGMPGLTMRAWYATLGLCPSHAATSRLRWNGCIAFAGGTATASGLELQTMRTTSPTLVGAEASASLDVVLAGPLSLGAVVGALVPFGAHRFFATVRGVDVELYKTWPVIPTVGLSLRMEGGP